MLERVKEIYQEIEHYAVQTRDQLEQFRLRYVSRKGVIAELFEDFKQVSQENRREIGQELNSLKELAKQRLKEYTIDLENSGEVEIHAAIDLTLPGIPNRTGALHPLTIVRQQIIRIFERIGFSVADGPEIETDWYNFGALNFSENHPARDMQDTFFVEKDPDILLRTHTSTVQVHVMEQQSPPIRVIMPGRVYRNEAISARAHCMFHQIEGLYIDQNVGFRDLKDTLYHFVKELFAKDVQVRFRPSYFPFTEPSAEMDISCQICHGKGCTICKYSGWVEIAGSGMVDPNVLKNCGIDPDKYTGFAFGMGVERITQLRYGVNDLRLYTENDVRFLGQFRGA